MKPYFLTFTGVDADTDFSRLIALSQRYPLEWGVLFSVNRQGREPRYPSLEAIEEIRKLPVSKAAHLCGEYAEAVMVEAPVAIDFTGFNRIQINSRRPDAKAIASFAQFRNLGAVMQTREIEFPADEGVSLLFDRSGGNGRTPDAWPKHPGDRMVGYAGGISPDTIEDVLSAIDASGPHWLDMESGIRTDDRLDLDKCEAVARAVYD